MDHVLEVKERLDLISPANAQKVVDSLFSRVQQLVSFPYSGPVYERAGLPQIRELLVRPYRVIYEVTDQQIRIMAVYHQHQNP